MSWLETDPHQEKFTEYDLFWMNLPEDMRKFDVIDDLKEPVLNDKRFLYRGRAMIKTALDAMINYVAVWLDREGNSNPRYVDVESLRRTDMKLIGVPQFEDRNLHHAIKIGSNYILIYNEPGKEMDIVISPSKEELDAVLKLVYKIEKPEIPTVSLKSSVEFHSD